MSKKIKFSDDFEDTIDDLCGDGLMELHSLLTRHRPKKVVAAVYALIKPKIKDSFKSAKTRVANSKESLKFHKKQLKALKKSS